MLACLMRLMLDDAHLSKVTASAENPMEEK